MKSVVAATVPLSTLVTYSVVTKPWSTAVMSHGPLIGPPAIVLTTFPELSSASRHPALAVFALPSEVGRLPTITNPLRVTASAVVSPTPPGHGRGRNDTSARAAFALGPPLRPRVERRIEHEELTPLVGQPVPLLTGLDDSGGAQLGQAIVED